MAERALQLYEAMFLVEPGIATDWEAAKGMVETIMERAKAQLLVCRLWDERRLAYPIKKQRRAAYSICYFRANGSAIGGIERDTQLSEHLLRVLVLRADHITDDQLEEIKETPDRRLQPAASTRQPVTASVARPAPKTDETASSTSDQDDTKISVVQASEKGESDNLDDNDVKEEVKDEGEVKDGDQ